MLSDAILGSVFGLGPSIIPVNIAGLESDDPMLQRLHDMDLEAQQLQRQMLLEQQEGVSLIRRDSKGARPGSKTKTPPRPATCASRLPASVAALPFDLLPPPVSRVERGNIAAELLPVREIHVDSQHVGRLPAYENIEVAAEGNASSLGVARPDAPEEPARDSAGRPVRRISSGASSRCSGLCCHAMQRTLRG